MARNTNYKKSAWQRTVATQATVKRELDQGISTPTLRRKVMRFGKYKNYEYRDLPMDYLKWAILNLNDDHLTDDLIRELQRRDSSFIL
jgi:hypothetical protein